MNLLINFLNSSFFLGLVTIIAGSFALYLYKKQKADEKESAAMILVNEIRNAEFALQQIKDTLLLDSVNLPEIAVLPENSWNKYSYLFSKDFDQDDIRLITKFYSEAERVGYIVTQANNMFLLQVTARTQAIQQANIAILKDESNSDNMLTKINELNRRIYDNNIPILIYNPTGFINKLKNYLPDIDFLLSTSAGAKLKAIAKID